MTSSAKRESTRLGVRRRPWGRRVLLRFLTAVGPAVISVVLRVLGRTLRITLVNFDELSGAWARGEQVIVTFWHNRLLMMPFAANGARICVLVSHHRDGEIATRALSHWGIHAVRGSVTRGAVGGFQRLVNAYRQGYSLAVAPDGPRGPRYAAKPGVIHLAKATGAPIFPATYAASRALRLRSWDRLIIPLPFSRVTIAVGDPVRVSRAAAAEQMEEHRLRLERCLNELTRAAETRLAA